MEGIHNAVGPRVPGPVECLRRSLAGHMRKKLLTLRRGRPGPAACAIYPSRNESHSRVANPHGLTRQKQRNNELHQLEARAFPAQHHSQCVPPRVCEHHQPPIPITFALRAGPDERLPYLRTLC